MYTSILISVEHITSTMNCLSKDNVQFLDLPDELILIIMNKVKSRVLLLNSIITIGNNRLEQLALDNCHSIDLTFDYVQSPYETLIQRFYSHIMPHIIDNIQSLTINIRHIPDIITFAQKNYNGTLPNLTHLKIMIGRQYDQTGTPYTLDTIGMELYRTFRRSKPLLPIIPQFARRDGRIGSRILSTVRCSPLMRSIISFELYDDCILPVVSNPEEFDECVCLLSQLGSQLSSFTISIVYVYAYNSDIIISRIASISCPYLKQLTMKIYQNIIHYEQCIVPLLRRLSNVEYLTLLLAIDGTTSRLNNFVNGFDLEKDILSYMRHLHQFNFHIRTIFENATHVEIDTIRQSFMKYQQESVDCAVDFFNNNYGQCQIYSLPFIGNRLDFISNRFPLFNMTKTFSMVTMLLLFDDVKSFENLFFARIARDLSHLKTLELFNELEQQEKTKVTTNNIDFTHLSTLILFDIHMDYAEQFLYRSHLPSLIELAIHEDILLAIITQDQQQARNNCSKVEHLVTLETLDDSIDAVRNFFPLAFH
ncbi:unnamed protein product [Rotaria sordida]|uniref:F-box domain-containing protein n=1 Tax=Rotaria sordida TaxID=392033 RepID=A0A818JPL7_9BILA|nr:unnamed protein product [Rotaria sordida]CAF3539337.1 unnamed protein product [Rotaria sordida]